MSIPAPIFERRSEATLPRVLAALGLALAVHGLLVAMVATLSQLGLLQSPPRPIKPQQVAMVSLSPQAWAAARQVAGERPPPVEPTPEKRVAKAEPMPKGQIVDVATGNDQRPDDAAYLAEHDNRVAKESRAREQTANFQRAMATRTSPVQGPEKKTPTAGTAGKHGNDGRADDDRVQHEGERAGHQELPAEKPQAKLAMLEAPHGEVRTQAPAKEQHGNSPRLLLTPGELARIDDSLGSLGRVGARGEDATPAQGEQGNEAGAAANDHLDKVPVGDGTFLNTREFRYAQFFNRIKQRVSEQWNVDAMFHQRDPSGQLYGLQPRSTVLGVALDRSGRIRDVTIVESSGLTFLDQECVAAFERAQPFPNPPAALFGEQEVLRFAFGFYVEPEHGSSAFRTYRSRD